jgi:hypothetical protein
VSSPLDHAARLRNTALGAATFAFLASAVLLFGPAGKRLAMPGELASVHGPLAKRCEACHPTGTASIKHPLHGVRRTDAARLQSRTCLACHAPGDDAFGAHGWAPDKDFDLALARSAGVPGAAAGAFECAMCHHEHRGATTDLARLDDARCQACHAESFPSFADGHPELENYGRGRAALAFNHARHVERHFPESEYAPTACTDCHVPAADGARMLVRDFATSCAACHAEVGGASQVEGAGLVFLSLPAVDTYALDDAGIAIGSWPADSEIVETGFSPFAELLLGDDWNPGAARDALDLSRADDDAQDAVANLVWAYKALLGDLSSGGHAALRRRVEAALERDLSEEEAADLVALLPGELVASALEAWVPSLASELERHASGASVEPADDAEDGDLEHDRSREAWVASGGWYRQEADFSLRYRPSGHADAFLTRWIELTSGARPGSAAERVFEHLTDRGATGRCVKCHRVDDARPDAARELAREPGRGRVAWRPAGPELHSLTHFSHAPHLIGLDEDGCLACHALDSGGDPDRDSGFRALEIADCASCHSGAGAADGCLTCHRYHERSSPQPLPPAPLVRPAGAPGFEPVRR